MTSATGSPASTRSDRSSTGAPIARSTSRNAVRVGFTFTPTAVTRAPGSHAAAANRKAAAEKSPGTRTSVARRTEPPRTQTLRPPPGSASHSSRTPNAGSMRSVWSRAGPGSVTRVAPLAESPAISVALATCALGIGTA